MLIPTQVKHNRSHTPGYNSSLKPMKGRDILSFLEKYNWPLVDQLDETTSNTPRYAKKYMSLENIRLWFQND